MAHPTLEDVRDWDRDDTLRDVRDRFLLPGGVVYLDGNSLGPLPCDTAARQVDIVRRQWGERLIASWNTGPDGGWLAAPLRIGDKIARLVGAAPGEIAVADSTSVNLFKLLVAGLGARPGRSVVLTEAGNFPTDRNIAEGAVRCVHGASLRVVPTSGIEAALEGERGAETAVLLLTHVHYRSGFRHDMAALTAAAHRAGALVLWDLSHSTGAVPVDLGSCDVDLAVGCGYKFLNGGPGAPAFLYAASRLHDSLASPLQGWMGHAAPFDFAEAWRPAQGIGRFFCGTPPILSLLALESGVDLFLSVDSAAVFAKAARLFDLFADLVAAWCRDPRLVLRTPRDPERRGSQIAFEHPAAERIMQVLIAEGVVGDYRPPALLRFGLTPLYLGFEDVFRAAAILAKTVGGLGESE